MSDPLLVTLDTGVLDQFRELEEAASAVPGGVDFVNRERQWSRACEHETRPDGISATYETAFLGEWRLDMAKLASDAQAALYEQIRSIISARASSHHWPTTTRATATGITCATR